MATEAKTIEAKKATTAKAQTSNPSKAKAQGKKTKATKKVKTPKVDKAKLDTKNTKDTVKQTVKSTRQIKYKYPDGLEDTLKRKAWRQKTRNTLRSLESAVAKAEDKKDIQAAEKKLAEFRKEVFLVP